MSITSDIQTCTIRKRVPLALIDRPDWARQVDPAVVTRLIESIRAYGLLQPVVLTPNGDRYYCVAGTHRVEALRGANEAEAESLVLPDGTLPQDALACSLHENHVRCDESLSDAMRRVTALMQYHGCKSRAGAARLAGMSESKLSKLWFAVDKLTPQSLAYATEHRVGLSVCYEVARRVASSDDQFAFLKAHVRGEMPRDEIAPASRRRLTSPAKTRRTTPKSNTLTISGVVNQVRIRLAFSDTLPANAVEGALTSVVNRFREHTSTQPFTTFTIG